MPTLLENVVTLFYISVTFATYGNITFITVHMTRNAYFFLGKAANKHGIVRWNVLQDDLYILHSSCGFHINSCQTVKTINHSVSVKIRSYTWSLQRRRWRRHLFRIIHLSALIRRWSNNVLLALIKCLPYDRVVIISIIYAYLLCRTWRVLRLSLLVWQELFALLLLHSCII